jgi:hypothetical protein
MIEKTHKIDKSLRNFLWFSIKEQASEGYFTVIVVVLFHQAKPYHRSGLDHLHRTIQKRFGC